MFDAAAQVVAAANIDNQIEVVADTAITDDEVASLATLTAAMPPNLVSGETGFADGKLYAKGIYLNDASKATFEAAAAAAGATATLEPRPTASTDDAAALKQELNDLVAAEPILFDPGRDTIKAESQATLDKVAAIANKYAGVAIAIQGHTDSQGSEAGNQTLSDQRAAAVLQALVQRNVDANQLTSVGFGETQLILENGVENATKSRRVVFDVATNN
jgi:OOP family OmpA-OmpF porin